MKDVAERGELLELLSARAREGSVSAAKTLLEELRREGDEADGERNGFEALDNVTPIRKSA